MSGVGCGKLTTIGELTSVKLSDHRAWKLLAIGMVLGNGTEVRMGNTYGQGESGRGKETDRCPLILPPPSKCGVMTHEDHQEVARSALVKGMESKMTALIWHVAPGCLWWNCTIFDFACS
jgi:hypothetical protein